MQTLLSFVRDRIDHSDAINRAMHACCGAVLCLLTVIFDAILLQLAPGVHAQEVSAEASRTNGQRHVAQSFRCTMVFSRTGNDWLWSSG